MINIGRVWFATGVDLPPNVEPIAVTIHVKWACTKMNLITWWYLIGGRQASATEGNVSGKAERKS